MTVRHRNDGLRKVCGCSRRKWAKCPHPWYFNFKWNGVHHRSSLDRKLGRRVKSKTEAMTIADDWRSRIRAGTFSLVKDAPVTPETGAVLPTLTLDHLFDAYERGHVMKERPESQDRWRTQVDAIGGRELMLPIGAARRFGDWAVTDITTDALRGFQDLRRAAGVFAMNRDVAVLRAVFNWALAEGLMERTPFKRGGVTTVKQATEPKRSRRLESGEGERLLAACGADLRPLVEAALEAGCRRGELLSLQWSQVRLDGPRPAIVLMAAKTKTRTLREVPISTRLRAILDLRKLDAAGKERKASDYVFGTSTGERVASIKRTWHTAILKAHGIKPTYTESNGLTEECRAELRRINLHFHDLRREAGSRWLDAGVPLHTIQRWLGHTNISQTSTYLAVTDTGSHEAMARFDVVRSVVKTQPETAIAPPASSTADEAATAKTVTH